MSGPEVGAANATPPISGDVVLPRRVVLGTDTYPVRILVPGCAPIGLSGNLMEALFAHGLRVGSRSHLDAPQPEPQVVDGPTKFLVGDFDLGVETGMRAVRIGLEHALAATLAALSGTAVVAALPSDEDEPDADGAGLPRLDVDARRRAALAHLRNLRTPEVSVEIADFEAEFDRHFALVEHGTRLVLLRNGQPVVEAVPWEIFRAEQEARAWTSLAFWTSWVRGRFESDRYVEMVDELMTMPDEPGHRAGETTAAGPETPAPAGPAVTGRTPMPSPSPGEPQPSYDAGRSAGATPVGSGAGTVQARVELGPDATVTFESDREEPAVLEPDTLTGLFMAGLHAPPRERSVKPSGSARLVLDGDARFLVGTLDLGRKRGMRVIMRGLAFALDAVKSELDVHDTVPPQESPEPAPEVARGAAPEPGPMSVTELAGSFDDVFARVVAGEDVTIAARGRPAAALVSWRRYSRLRELLARLDAAQWAAAADGRFDPEVYAGALQDLRVETTTAIPSTPDPTRGGGEDDR